MRVTCAKERLSGRDGELLLRLRLLLGGVAWLGAAELRLRTRTP